MQDTPQISSCGYTSTTGALGSMTWGDPWSQVAPALREEWGGPSNALNAIIGTDLRSAMQNLVNQPTEIPMANPARRIVQVFIADPNENVPLDDSVLFKGEQKLTDLTDNELFFEVPIAETLKAHNEKRVKWIDKESTKRAGKDVTLDPVKIRELKMVVVTIAQF